MVFAKLTENWEKSNIFKKNASFAFWLKGLNKFYDLREQIFGHSPSITANKFVGGNAFVIYAQKIFTVIVKNCQMSLIYKFLVNITKKLQMYD